MDHREQYPKYFNEYIFINYIISDHSLKSLFSNIGCDDILLFTTVKTLTTENCLHCRVGSFAGSDNFLIFLGLDHIYFII